MPRRPPRTPTLRLSSSKPPGDPGAAARFVHSVLDTHPGDAAALSLASRLALGAGRPGEAVGLLERAVEAAPWNGAYQELLVYALKEDRRSRQALVAAETALLRIEDHAPLWYLAAILREEFGHRARPRSKPSPARARDVS